METVKAFIERNNEGIYSVYVDLENKSLNYGIHGTGDTAREAVDDFNSAYEAMKEFHKQKGKEFVEATFVFQYDMASFLQYYSNVLSLAGLERLTGVNQGQLSHYMTGVRKPSKSTTHKIETAIHQFANDLSQVKFV